MKDGHRILHRDGIKAPSKVLLQMRGPSSLASTACFY